MGVRGDGRAGGRTRGGERKRRNGETSRGAERERGR